VEESILITKKLNLDMAHALDNYDGKCKFIHGHTFHFSVTLKGFIINEENNPKNGMVMDFGELKTILKEEIGDKFDHSLVLKDTSPYRVISEVNADRINLLPFQPTCENLLVYFIEKVRSRLPNDIELHSASLQETPSNIAEWQYSDSLVFS
jgi:6-pyruvoyltetrahydropterin/6-carboxytetrahydropterin synthase